MRRWDRMGSGEWWRSRKMLREGTLISREVAHALQWGSSVWRCNFQGGRVTTSAIYLTMIRMPPTDAGEPA